MKTSILKFSFYKFRYPIQVSYSGIPVYECLKDIVLVAGKSPDYTGQLATKEKILWKDTDMKVASQTSVQEDQMEVSRRRDQVRGTTGRSVREERGEEERKQVSNEGTKPTCPSQPV